MNAIREFLLSPLAERLGWGLLHFLWEGAVIAALLAVALWVLRNRSPNARYLAGWVALVAMACAVPLSAGLTTAFPTPTPKAIEEATATAEPPADAVMKLTEPARIDFLQNRPQHEQPQAVLPPTTKIAARPAVESRPAVNGELATRASLALRPALPWLVGGWLTGTLVLALWHLGGWWQLGRLRRVGTREAPDTLQQMLADLLRRFAMRGPVKLLVSARVAVPTLIGWLRPVILMPASVLAELPPQQLELILAHELAHLRRCDYLLNLVQTAIETLLFYHPAVWWVSRQIRVERESCCDEEAAAAAGDRLLYARALASLAELCRQPACLASQGLALGANGGSLSARIRRVLGLPARDKIASPAWLGGGLAALVLIAAMASAMASAGDKAGKAADSETATETAASPQQEPAPGDTGNPAAVNQAPETPRSETQGTPKELTVDLGGGVKMEMVLIPAGEFLMGWPDSDKDASVVDERPLHRVRITRPLYLGKYEVTQEQWEAVMHNNPSYTKGPRYPVETVIWDDCQKFLEKLNAKSRPGEGKFKLPTEAQWEYACRAGSTTKYCFGDEESGLGEYAWYWDEKKNENGRIHPVGEKKPNAWGLYDMHGNVWEWCADRYDSRYYAHSPTDDPTGPSEGSFRVGRGGGFDSSAWVCRSASRRVFAPRNGLNYMGLRVAREFDAGNGGSQPTKEASGDARAKDVRSAAVQKAPETPRSETIVAVSGRVVDNETGRPVDPFVVQEGRVDNQDPAKIKWGYGERGTPWPNPKGLFDEQIRWGDGRRARIVAAGYLPQSILDKAPAAGLTVIKDHVVRLKRGREIAGRVLYHDGTPAAGVTVFLGFDERHAWITAGKAWTGSETEPDEDRLVARTTTDSAGRFKLTGGGSDGAKTIAVSAPRLDAWAVPAPEAGVNDSDFTIKLPQPGRLIVHYDIAGGPAQAKLVLQLRAGYAPGFLGVRSVRLPMVANGGQIVLDNLPPVQCDLGRYKSGSWGGRFCDRRTVTIESGKTATSDFVRRHGTPVQGQIAGLKQGMFADNIKPGALVHVRPVEVKGAWWGDGLWKLTVFDVLPCGLDGKFQTERLSPGRYAVTAEAYLAMTHEESISTGERLPAFVGRAEVTVPEDGPPLQVTVELRPREEKPPAKPADAKSGSLPAKEAAERAAEGTTKSAAVKQAPETPRNERMVAVSGRVVDDATGRPVEEFVVEEGHVDGQDPAKIAWGFSESRTTSPNPEGRFRAWIEGGLRKRVLAAGYWPQPILEKEPAAGVTQIKDLVVRLKRSREITGRILYHDGSPAAGVSVFLLGEGPAIITGGKAWRTPAELGEDRAVARTTTDSAGRFRPPGAGGEGAKTIAVSGPRLDFWALPTPAADAKDSGFTIKLPQPGRLVVHYDVAGGDAQAKLLLQLYAWAGPNSRGVFNMREPMVANRGQIVLDNLPPGYYDLSRQKPDASAGARGGFRCDLRTVIIESGKTATSDFVRQHGTRVHGRIVGLKEGMFADNMKPGALVTVGPAWASAYSWHLCKWQIGILDGLRCGPDGKFQTEPLEPGKYSVIAEAYLAPKPEDRTDQSRRLPAFVGRAEVTVPEEGAAPQVTVELRLRAKSDGGESEKRPAGVPAGHGDAATPAKVPPGELAAAVADAAGKPLAGVLAEVWTWCPGDKTTTDEEGRFVLKNLGSEPVELRVSKKGFGPWYNPVQPTGVELHVTLSDKTYFEGDVKGPDGKPVGDALIRADSGPKRNPQVEITSVWTETRTDQNGHYRLCVMPDKYVIHVRVPKVGVARLPQTLIGEGEAKRLDINLTPGVKFRAIAVDSQSGDPIANVRLSNWRHKGIEGTSGQDGKIAIDGMTPGHFAFDVTCKGYTRWWSPQAVQQDQKKDLSRDLQRNFDYLEFDVTDDMPPVRIELEREVRISGVVQDPDGNPVAGATAAPAHTGTGNSLTGDTRFSVVTGKDGTFVMSLPASGNAKYNLEAHDGGYQQWRKWANGVLDPIQTKPGDELKNVVIKLTRPATVRGHVKDESGKPLADREVRASAADKLENRYYDPTTTTDKEGNFALRFIRPGDHFIQAAPFWATDVPAGQNLLRVPVKNSLRVTLKEGETKAGVELEAPASTRFPSVEEQIHRAIEEQIRRESEKAAYPAAQPGHQGAAAAQTLSFGPVKDGMQAAAEVSADEPFQVRFHIRNASAQTVTIAGNGLRQDAECIIEDQQGRRVAVKKTIPWFTYEMKRDKVEPGGETIFPNGGLSFLPQRNCWDYPSYTAQAKPGRYTVRFRLHFPWEPVSEKPGPQDWKGDLETAPVTIEVKEPSVAAQKLLANKLAEIQKLEAELASLPSKKGLTEAQRSTATSNLETHLGALKENAESVRALIQKIRTEKGTSPLSHSPEATSPEAPAKPPAAKPDPPASQPAKHSTVGTGQWHRLATGELASVDVERTLYEKEGQRHFFIRVRITNLANRPVGIDLNNYWKVTYPNQWGMENADHRTDIDERRMVPKDLDAAAREELLAAFRTGGLTTIPPGKSIDYYREFNASGRADVDAQEKQGKYLIVSLDGVLRLTDGEGVEQVSCAWGRKTQAPTDLVIPTPVPWRAIPSAGRIVAERADTLPALIQYHSERLGLTLKVPKGWIEMEGAGDRSRVLALAEPEPWRDRVQTKLELRVEDAAGNVALSLTDKADSSATVSKRISVDGVPARVTGYRLPPDNKAEILTLQVAKNSRFYTASLVFGSDRREFYLALADAVFQSLRPDVAGDAKKSPGDPQPDAKPAGAAAVAVKAMASGT